MKQLTKRILSLAFALMLFASIAGTAYALSHDPAGIYIWIGGTSEQSQSIPSILNTTTYVKLNPDRAKLETKVEFSDGVNRFGTTHLLSERGETLFASDFTICIALDYEVLGAHCTHGVHSGSQSETGYAYYTYTDIESSLVN